MTPEQIKVVEEIISDELLKRGFFVNVMVEEDVKNKMLKITSSTFQTVPVLFKKLYIEGWGKIRSEEFEGRRESTVIRHSVYLSFDARVETFSSGCNGIELFGLWLTWFNDDKKISVG